MAGTKVTVPNPPEKSWRSTLSLGLWMGAIHLNIFVALIVLFGLPNLWAFRILGFWLCLIFVPLFERSKFSVYIAKFVIKYVPSYFPISVYVEDLNSFDPNRAYVIAAEPHSVLPLGIIILTEYCGYLPFKKIKCLASSAIFYTPVLRHIWTWLGLVPASRKQFGKLLSQGYTCVLVPGGVQECLYLDNANEVIFLKKRYGFIRCAMESGAPLVPTFCFGQNQVFHFWKPRGSWYEQLSRKIGFTPLLFWGKYGSPIPYDEPIYVAMGKPIEVEKNVNPSKEEIAVVHAKFLAAMEELYEKHKGPAGFKDHVLSIY